ncbi:MAG: hypothetical protein QG653_372, partial [Patescibacteria group bacterium]|nr:hypothetical protein [Patescibacteria group bacterium]
MAIVIPSGGYKTLVISLIIKD